MAERAPGPDPGIRLLARALTLIENEQPGAAELLDAFRATRAAWSQHATDSAAPVLIGITGSPGAGKSSVVAGLISAYRSRGMQVAVLAVDPSSPFTSGAVLGDRVRMQQHATDPGVFIRSMAARGHLGGLASSSGAVIDALMQVGFEVVIVETVGVGQSEVEIAMACDSVVVVVAPGMGDAVQAAKAGVLEIADILVVNKADREGADMTARDLRQMIALGDAMRGDSPDAWRPDVVLTTAVHADGVNALMKALDVHQAWLSTSGERSRRRIRRARSEIVRGVLAAFDVRVRDLAQLEEIAAAVAAGELEVHRAVEQILMLMDARSRQSR